MQYEYLLLNCIIIAGPLALSFESKMRFITKWRFAFPAILLVAIPYLIWDAAVTGVHWRFNEAYTLDFRIAGLPIEEWLFFVTVPFAGIFIWESLRFNYANRVVDRLRFVRVMLYLCLPVGVLFFFTGKHYTGLMFIFLSAVAFFDHMLKTGLLTQRLLYIYLTIASALIVVFNGYLTARPVVLYDAQYQVGIKVGSIPIEDFGYGLSLLLLVTIFYEKFKAVHG